MARQMTRQVTPARRKPVCGTGPTTDPADAVIRLRRAELRLEVLATALRALADAEASTPQQRRQCASDTAAMLDGAGL